MEIRGPYPHELGSLATLWFQGWQDGHAKVTPPELAALRTLPDFTRRLATEPGKIFAAFDPALLGFHILRDNSLYQFYVSGSARGTGAAQALMYHAEEHLRSAGFAVAQLDCAVGNTRAIRFYEKSGWVSQGVRTVILETSLGGFPLEVIDFQRNLHVP